MKLLRFLFVLTLVFGCGYFSTGYKVDPQVDLPAREGDRPVRTFHRGYLTDLENCDFDTVGTLTVTRRLVGEAYVCGHGSWTEIDPEMIREKVREYGGDAVVEGSIDTTGSTTIDHKYTVIRFTAPDCPRQERVPRQP